MSQGCGCNKADRYVSFQGIDCAGHARKIMEMIERIVSVEGQGNAFWDYFMKKRAGGSGPKPDDLFLIHSHINEIKDLFESWGDRDAILLLLQVEEECC